MKLRKLMRSRLVLVYIITMVGSLLIGVILAKSCHGAEKAKPKTVTMEVTGYCPCEKCCGKWAKIPMSRRRTASGKLLKTLIKNKVKFCAADKSVPFGTVYVVPGMGRYTVEDRGGAIKGGKIDLFFFQHSAALKFGRRIMSCKRIEK